MDIFSSFKKASHEERPARVSQRPRWETIRRLGRISCDNTGAIPWFATEAKDISYLKGFKMYYI